jgi:N-acyl-D-amino-acid deacylase
LTAGALGLSSGLEYDPGIYSNRAEVLALAKTAGDAGGRYISHIRSEDRYFWEAIDEIIEIGRANRMPVQISHMKLGMIGLWGLGDSLLAILNRARSRGVDVTADVYPYRHWQSGLSVLFPARDFTDRAAAQFALAQVSPADSITLQSGPNRGKTIGQLARERGTDPATTLMSLLTDGGGGGIIAAGMSEPDIEKLLAWPHTNVSSDGSLTGGHPRGWGSFPRVLGVYARERRVISIAEAIRKMTSLPAAHVGIRNRGRIVPGAYADFVLFDTTTVADRATFEQPQALSDGIVKVWVNGVLAFDQRAPTGAMAGRLIRRGDQ